MALISRRLQTWHRIHGPLQVFVYWKKKKGVPSLTILIMEKKIYKCARSLISASGNKENDPLLSTSIQLFHHIAVCWERAFLRHWGTAAGILSHGAVEPSQKHYQSQMLQEMVKETLVKFQLVTDGENRWPLGAFPAPFGAGDTQILACVASKGWEGRRSTTQDSPYPPQQLSPLFFCKTFLWAGGSFLLSDKACLALPAS